MTLESPAAIMHGSETARIGTIKFVAASDRAGYGTGGK
jgi:hypothetical protein